MMEDPISNFAVQHNFTPRETQLLRVVAKHGYTNEQLADALNIQRKTVNIHMTKVLAKTACSSTRELLSKIITQLLPEQDQDGEDDIYETRGLERTNAADSEELSAGHD